MHDIYDFVSGPMVWVSLIIFAAGCIYRFISMALLAKEKDPFLYNYMSPYHALRSIFHWLTPFGSENMRKNPVFTIVAFSFHICVVIAPLFLFAHIILIKQSWNVSWWFISDTMADIMTLIVIASCVFFLIRRIVRPEVKFLTSASDYIILAMVAAPFITGFWTYHQFAGCRIMGIIHILSGEILLAAIPFTRLSHMIFFPISRGYIGSEFGAIRHAKDW
ncbi:MAG: respiratory nitrate reductase subunit gamma [Desulfobacterium sp.]|nr:respiratory nitrate reductase subunit gamma [Desulfobacterium sp.]MBU3947372.1 respiratory nitrate reductase subunit gamma [Pseudomonadota bacterium]MBU4011202.1 respiratory nitrate reductase subunit gamma [Pseudomonadota bacterium]MBU4037186.1 respiratory nitrate reductase subunit gamma [Pseudomonadota bacterium]